MTQADLQQAACFPGTSAGAPARAARLAEFIVLFGVAPTLLAIWMRGALVFPAIWTLAVLASVLLLTDPTFERRRLWSARSAAAGLRGMLGWFVLLGAMLAAGLWVYEPERILELPQERTGLWLMIMVLYPILSVYPQEVAFRAFVFHRYACVFRTELAMILASSAAFGYAHVIMHNWWAVTFSFVGGLLFGYTYHRSRSLAATSLEHALYGCYLFTIGWGWYFYGGNVGR